MKMAMTAMAVVLMSGAVPALAHAQETPGAEDHDRPHRDGERQAPRPPPAPRPPTAAPAPQAPAAAPPRVDRGGEGVHWTGGGYPGRGGVWNPGANPPPQAQPQPSPPPRPPSQGGGDHFRGGDPQDRGDRAGHDRGRDDHRDDGRRDWDRHDGDRHDGDRRDTDRRDTDRRDWDRRDHDGDRRDWGRYEGDSRSWGRYDWDRRWAGHEERPRWEHGRYPPIYVSPHRYRHAWRAPPGFYLRAWSMGEFLPRAWFGPDWFLDSPWDYDLPLPPPGFDWVRSGPDALLIDDYTGRIVQVVRNVFW